MKKSDIKLKLFTEGFDTYERLYLMEHALRKAAYELETRMNDTGLGRIDDKDDIFTDEEQLRLKKLATAIGRAESDIHEKTYDYRKSLVYKNLDYEDDTSEKNTDTSEDEFY